MADPTALTGLAPTGAVGIVLAALSYVMREWRLGRQAEVAYQQKRADDAEAERDRLAEQHAQDRAALVGRVGALEAEVRGMREDNDRYIRSLVDRHRDEVRTLSRRVTQCVGVAYRLREHMAANGLDLPDDLDPDRPDATPQLGIASPAPSTTDDL